MGLATVQGALAWRALLGQAVLPSAPKGVAVEANGGPQATQLPLLPPCFSSSFTSVMTMPRSAALHMS